MLKPEIVERALREVRKGYAQYQYFFDHLDSPAWLQPLAAQGFFKKAPPPEREGDYVRFAWWPESRFLVRMSRITEAQLQVVEIARQLEDPENSRVHDDVAEIALSVSPELSVKLVPQICRYTESPINLLLAEKIGDLIVHLASGNQTTTALQLAACALALVPGPASTDEAESPNHTGETQAKFRTWEYGRIIQKSLLVLAKVAGLETVKLFSGLLNDVARFSFKKSETGNEDYFYIRLPAIESSASRDDIPSLLLCATRDAAAEAISSGQSNLEDVIAVLRPYKWASFRRLELHLSRMFPIQGCPVVEQLFENPDILDSPGLRHEAVLSLRECFPSFGAQRRNQILAWMDAGPSEDSIRRWLEFVGETVTDENIQKLRKIRRRNRFSILEGQLPEPYKSRYESLVAEYGAPDAPEAPPVRFFRAVGAQSPKSAKDLAAMPVAEIIAFLGRWTPSSDFQAPTAEGLGVTLSPTVAERPDEFIAAAPQFKTLDPTYVRSFMGGLTIALKNGKTFDWRPVLELAAWVSNQPREIAGRKGGLFDKDPDWGWTRDSIIDLLTAAFEVGKDRLPFEHRKLVWETLLPITADPSPSAEDEKGEKFDPSFLSINSTRGRAMHAAMSYGEWVRQSLDAGRRDPKEPPATLDAIPELREVLERHLDVAVEPTLTIRSVYGQHLSWLAGFDLDWLRTNLHRIFPDGKEESRYFNAAWESFVVFNRPHKVFLRELMPAYKKAVAEIGSVRMIRSPASSDESLAQHLLVYYWWGELSPDDPLMEDFYQRASDRLRGQTMWFIGRSVSGWDDSAPPEAFERLKHLVDERLRIAEVAKSPSDLSRELANFGWWLTSDKFGDEWLIQSLFRVLRLTKKIENEMESVKYVAECSARYPGECLECLGLVIEGEREGWLLSAVAADARTIITTALNCNRPDVALAAGRLIQRLIAMGHYEFRDLLA